MRLGEGQGPRPWVPEKGEAGCEPGDRGEVEAQDRPPTVSLHGISKSFSGVPVLADVDFTVAAGEVHALVGENGAGKSTLIKIMAGVHQPSAGRIAIDGGEVRFRSPQDAQSRGIIVIHQEFSTLPRLSVAENILLGQQPRNRLALLRWRAMRERAAALLAELGIRLDPRAPVSDLSVAERQMIEIAKALAREARVIVFDEPTAVISGEEARALFGIIRRLRARHVGVVYISHRLDEVFDLADRVTILKDGRRMATEPIGALDHGSIVGHMVGRAIQRLYPVRTRPAAAEAVLELRDLHLAQIVRGCTLTLHRGEILGLAGMAGAGRTELALGIIGALRVTGGEMRLRDAAYRPHTPLDALRSRIAYLTEDRKSDGLFPGQGVSANITAATLHKHLPWRLLDRASERATVRRWMQQLRIRAAGPGQAILKLSGGNQQKALFARCLETEPEILILDEPTRGVDVGTKAEIYALIDEIARAGNAVMVISSELPEVIGLADRILVMREGRIAGELQGAAATEAAIVSLATQRHVGAAA